MTKLFGSGFAGMPHSTYFFLLLYLGVFGLFYYLVFHALVLRELLRCRFNLHQKYVAIFGIGVILTMGISADALLFTSPQWVVYMLVGATLSIESESRMRLSRRPLRV